LHKNTQNEFSNNLTLNLSQDPDDLKDLNSLELERIEETILSIFKSYGNLSEKRDDNLDLEDSNKSFSEDSDNNKAIFGKGKIFGTTKIDKKFNKSELDDADNNLPLKKNWDLTNLSFENQKNFEFQTLQNLIGNSINQKGKFIFI